MRNRSSATRPSCGVPSHPQASMSSWVMVTSDSFSPDAFTQVLPAMRLRNCCFSEMGQISSTFSPSFSASIRPISWSVLHSYRGSVTCVYTISVSRLRWWPGKSPTRSHSVVRGSTMSAYLAVVSKKWLEYVTNSSVRMASIAVDMPTVVCMSDRPSMDIHLRSRSLTSWALNFSE